MSEKKTGLDLMREPFPAHQISKMCRSTKKDNAKGKCPKCNGWHGLPAVQLDYVGHAALTDRLLSADHAWQWEPLAVGSDGYPVIDRDGGMWIKLTVCGVTRYGYGDAQGKSGGDAMKERIGDALRNAAMRFGAALDLWHKGDLHVEEDEPEQQSKPAKQKLTESSVADFIVSIMDAESIDALKKAFQIAYRAAEHVSDTSAQATFEKAKDARKTYLQNELTAQA